MDDHANVAGHAALGGVGIEDERVAFDFVVDVGDLAAVVTAQDLVGHVVDGGGHGDDDIVFRGVTEEADSHDFGAEAGVVDAGEDIGFDDGAGFAF